MSTQVAARLHTAEDLEHVSAQGHRFELIRGVLSAMPPPAGADHGSTTKRLDHYLSSHIYEHELGECFTAETGFTIAHDPDTTLAPDWAFVRRDRLPRPIPRGFLDLAPDIVLETRSPGDSARGAADKAALWLEAGVEVVLDFDPPRRRLTVRRRDVEPLVLGLDNLLALEDVLPGFSLPLRRVFPHD